MGAPSTLDARRSTPLARVPRRVISLALVGLIFLPAIARAADPFAPEYAVTRLTTDNGLPQNTITCLCQTRDGYLWIGTRVGVARYDGHRFTAFSAELAFSDPGDLGVRDLTEDTEGRLSIRTGDGLISCQRGQFRRYSFREGPIKGEIHESYASRAGGLWLSLPDRLCHFENGMVTRSFDRKDGLTCLPVEHLREDQHGRLWFRCESAWRRLDPRAGKIEALAGVVGALTSQVDDLLVDRQGRLWLSSPGELLCWSDGRWSLYSSLEAWGQEMADQMVEDNAGDLWIHPHRTAKVVRFHNGEFNVCFDMTREISGKDIRCVRSDPEGNIWIGTGDGLFQLRPRRFSARLNTNLSGEKNEVFSVASGRDGRVWIGTGSGLTLYQNATFATYTNSHWNNYLPRYENYSAPVLEDHSGALWFGVGKEGLHTLREGQFSPVFPRRMDEREDRLIQALFEDRDGRLWIGSAKGLICGREKVLARYTTKEGLSDNHVVGILQAPDGSLWIGTARGGMNHFQNGRFQPYTTEHGLLSNLAKPLLIETDGAVWVATAKGLNRIRDGQIRSLTTRNGLFTDEVYCLLEDDLGNYWANSNRGIWRAKKRDLHAVADGRTNWLQCAIYGEPDGMASSEGNGEHQPSACKTPDGRLWFPTTKGVVVVDPASALDNDVAPPVLLEKVIADEKVVFGDGVAAPVKARAESRDAAETYPKLIRSQSAPAVVTQPAPSQAQLRLGPGRARVLEIHYTATSFVAPEKVRFKYKLEGHDPDWRKDDSNSRVIYYPNLRPGQYTFRVKACNSHGVWNEAGDALAFYLAPHFYKTWPFYGVCGLGLLGLAVGLQSYRLRVQRKILALQQQAALERERARIAQDMHDDLGASLTKIAILSEIAKRDLENKERAEANVEQISTTARSVVDNISELVWATNPKNDTLDNFVAYLREYAGRYFEATPIRCRLEFPPAIPPAPLAAEMRRNLFLVVKEALHNIVKHSEATEVAVELELLARSKLVEDTRSEFPLTPTLSPSDGERAGRGAKVRLILNSFTQHAKSNVQSSTLNAEALEIRIMDNGHGFDPVAVSRFSNGLQNMRRRVTELGGTFDVKSQPSAGTRVQVLLKL